MAQNRYGWVRHIYIYGYSVHKALMGPYAHTQIECEHLENRDEKDLASLYPEQCLALVDAQ